MSPALNSGRALRPTCRKPRVIIKEINDKKHEPVEVLSIDVPENFSGKVIELVSQRKGDMTTMEPKGDLMHLEFRIPSRGLIGLRTLIINGTAGEAVMSHRFEEYESWKGDIASKTKGALIVKETGDTVAYSIDKFQDRGIFFVPPGVE